MGVNRNTVVLFREIQDEGRKLLDQGVNPEITCEDKSHQKYVEDLLAGRIVKNSRNRITHDETYLMWYEIISLAKEAKKRGLGKVKFGCVDKLYQDRVERGKSYKQQRKEERAAWKNYKRHMMGV